MRVPNTVFATIILMILISSHGFCVDLQGYDWAMWRYDANRSAESPQELPSNLYLQWVHEYPKLEPTWDDPLNQDLMQFGKAYEPIVMGKTLFVGSSSSDWVKALDAETGDEKWTFYADGPIRLPLVADKGKVYFTSDDSYLYCLNAVDGKLIWKFQGGPSDRKVLGNERIISTWPARGGAVLKDGVIYFAASIWPFMGIFIYALDAETGKVIWANDSTGPIYMKQPHNSPSYAGVAPQGTLVISGDKLLIPCGRSVPACFDRNTGEMLYYHVRHVKERGMGFLGLHSTHFALPYKALMGTSCAWRTYVEDGKSGHIKVVNPSHPIAEGIGDFVIPHEEWYGEPYEVPEPEVVIFEGHYVDGKEIVRDGLVWTVGKGRVFYFRPGHETYPIYYMAEVRKIILNGVRWCASK